MGSAVISLTIDGRAVRVPDGATIWEAARELGIEIPALCHDPRLDPVGVCRLCLVDVGEKKYAASCVRRAEDGMEVRTSSERLHDCRRGLVELLLSDYPADAGGRTKTGADDLLTLAAELGVPWPAERVGGLPGGEGRGRDGSSKVIFVDHQACILCDRCIRGCDDLQVNEVMGRTGKGYGTRIAFDLDVPMGSSTCVSCGECEKVCPTGALSLSLAVASGAEQGPDTDDEEGWQSL